MKKIFTLIAVAFVALSVNAQLPENVYPYADITWGDITWKTGNNKTDINDAEGTKLYFVMGQGNAYKDIYCESFISEDSGEEVNRPYYTYVYYWQGITGVPNYGLYYKFTPAKDGKLKVLVWANKGNRATTVVPASTGVPMVMHTDYTVEGYINGQKVLDADGNKVLNADGQEIMRLFTNDEIKAIHENDFTNPWASLTEPDKDGNMPDKWNYVIAGGNQAFWGWLTFDVKAGDSYYVFQASSQLGFGGYDFTPTGGETESYVAALDMGGSIVMNSKFANAVDDNGVAKVKTDKGSVINIATANMAVEAVGSSTPTAITPDKDATAISTAKVDNINPNAPLFNLAGQKVSKSYKGVVIQNGKKMVLK